MSYLQIKRYENTSNPTGYIPKAGEPVWVKSGNKFYIGDGSTSIENLEQINKRQEGFVSDATYNGKELSLTIDGQQSPKTLPLFAPITSGTNGQVLVSGGNGNLPLWVNQNTLNSSTALKLVNNNNEVLNIGSNDTPVYFNNGVPVAGKKIYSPSSIGSNGQALVSNGISLVWVDSVRKADALGNLNVGNSSRPTYFKNGVPTMCEEAIDSAKYATTAGTLGYKDSLKTVGNVNTPVYFSNGVPVACNRIVYAALPVNSVVLSTTAIEIPYGVWESLGYSTFDISGTKVNLYIWRRKS